MSVLRCTVPAICPECGYRNGLTLDLRGWLTREMRTCERDTCGKEFVIEVTVPTPSVKVLKLTEVTG